ncbi:MAG: hypothetical protein AAF127_09805 [Pseudomonadota bacterium]
MSDDRAGELKRIKDELITFLQGEVEQRAARGGGGAGPAQAAAPARAFAPPTQEAPAPIDTAQLAIDIAARLDPVIESKAEEAVKKSRRDDILKEENKAKRGSDDGGSPLANPLLAGLAGLLVLALGFGAGYFLFSGSGDAGGDATIGDPVVPGTTIVPANICEWVADNRGQLGTYTAEEGADMCADLTGDELAVCQARANLAGALEAAIASGEGAACATPDEPGSPAEGETAAQDAQ